MNHTTEEWVDDRGHTPKFKPKEVNYTLSMSNSDLQGLPPLYSKDFDTPDAEIHLTVDKTALNEAPKLEEKKEDSGERKLLLDSPGKSDEDDWNQVFNSFGKKENLLDNDFSKWDPKVNELRDLAPSGFSSKIDSFSGDPKENLLDMMGGVSENDLLNSFVKSNTSGFEDDKEDINAFKQFESRMKVGNKNAKRVPILI